MPLTIRPAVPADLPALAALEQACFSHPWSENGLAETLQNGRSVFLAAEREGEVLGYLGMEFVLDEGSITNVAVFPGCRRQGVADALVTGLLQGSGHRPCHRNAGGPPKQRSGHRPLPQARFCPGGAPQKLLYRAHGRCYTDDSTREIKNPRIGKRAARPSADPQK